jgi:hypothetical protein
MRCHFRSWHKCEVPTASSNVRVRGQSGRHLLGTSISHSISDICQRKPEAINFGTRRTHFRGVSPSTTLPPEYHVILPKSHSSLPNDPAINIRRRS